MSEPSLPVRMPTAPATPLPRGACDAHTHVFGPLARFPLAHPPDFPLPDAPFERHREMRARVGIDRAILVQPAHYGFDHAALTDALGRDGQCRGIGLADAGVSEAALDQLHEAGVRGLRFTDFRNPDGSVRPGSVGVDQLRLLAPRLKERGWHAQVWAGAAALDEMLPDLLRLKAPVVLDHMAMVEVEAGVEAPRFQRLLQAVQGGDIWVKLSLCRVSTQPGFIDVRPFHEALTAANPERLLWGSDWPFIRLFDRSPDVGALLDLDNEWAGDAALRQAIMVDNPARLFGFDPS